MKAQAGRTGKGSGPTQRRKPQGAMIVGKPSSTPRRKKR